MYITTLIIATMVWWMPGSHAVLFAAPSTSAGASDASALDALRFAKQADEAGAAKDRERFTRQIDQALDIALNAGTRSPSHRIAEGIHALTEALARARQGTIEDAREDLHMAIVWLSRAAGFPDSGPSVSPLRKEHHMDHFVTNIEDATVENEDFRRVLYTAPNSQLVLMTLKPGEDIGAETHNLDQFIRIEAGRGTAQLNGKDYPIQDGSALVIPAGTRHNVINSGGEALKLYTLYSPPEHKDGTVHHTKRDAEADREDHFDGKTTAMMQESEAR